MNCIKCGKKIEEKNKFCPNCGEKVEKNEVAIKYCPHCGSEKIEDGKCTACNKNIKSDNTSIEDIIIYIASIMIPFFGIAFYFITRSENAHRAKISLIIGLFRIGFIFLIIFFIIFLLLAAI